MAKRQQRKTNAVFAFCVISCLALDLWSKDWVQRHYGPRQAFTRDLIPGVLGVWYKENAGGVFGIGQGKSHLFVAFTFVALAALAWLFLSTDRRALHMNLGIALISAGALGNLYDRLLNAGRVRDFIDVHIGDVYHWYTFNVADSCICIGVGLIALDAFLEGRRGRRSEGEPDQGDTAPGEGA